MFLEPSDTKPSLAQMVLIAALIVLPQDLSSKGGAQAWSYSSSSNRRWLEARQWCREHYTDMVFIRSKEENDYLNNLLPFNSKYYWIGVQKANETWIWARTNQQVPQETQNWAPNEPDNLQAQDCVELYIKREVDTGKWNNEGCRKRKGTICYKASCEQNSCSAHADCVETIGNHTCKCHPGFMGSTCEEAIECKPLLDPEHCSHSCINPYGSARFNSSCNFRCELGFQLKGVPELLCQASGQWNHPVPQCQVKKCHVLNDTIISAGSMNCSHPIAPYSYNSTCKFRCNEGFEIRGQDQIRCDHTSKWTASVPACTVKKCPPILFPVTGNMTCVDTLGSFSFGSRCNFTCQEGYDLTGDNTLECLASGKWSKPIPSCKVVQCNSLKAPTHASMQCQDLLQVFSYGSTCSIECEEGFDLIGTNMTKCSSQGDWSHALPVCRARRCPSLSSPSHGSVLCSDPYGGFSFGSQCQSTCEEGFLLNGTADTECMSLGRWTAELPNCTAKRCPTLSSPSHGSMFCSGPHGDLHFGSRCTSTCEEGFDLDGTADTDCTSLGRWSTDIPKCLAKKCPTLSSPSHGSLSCSGPHGEFRFASQCTSTCNRGFILNGTAETVCTSLGEWTSDRPRCLAHPCPLLAKAPQYGKMNCSHLHSPFSFGSLCDFDCSEGFSLTGNPTLACNQSGLWSQNLPTCQPVQCGAIQALSVIISMNCSHPLREHSFGSQCHFTCRDGYSLNGTEMLFCSSGGVWNDSLPQCMVEGISLGAALLMYTGIGAAAVAVPLLLIGVAFLIIIQLKKGDDSILSNTSAWGDRENPAFEFD
ncbi:P-selectin [Notolabrus celidotus]|uniref:P-selectin n=1 Tax=Notolabrus celidotus TaxID=1203425 RepID=UPI0014903002|nr:P-selectin [Notolabrus celidotus]